MDASDGTAEPRTTGATWSCGVHEKLRRERRHRRQNHTEATETSVSTQFTQEFMRAQEVIEKKEKDERCEQMLRRRGTTIERNRESPTKNNAKKGKEDTESKYEVQQFQKERTTEASVTRMVVDPIFNTENGYIGEDNSNGDLVPKFGIRRAKAKPAMVTCTTLYDERQKKVIDS